MTSKPNLFLTVLALSLGAFAIGTSEFAAMGLLPFYSTALGLNEPQSSLVISAYALGVVVGAPLTTLLGARLPRRRYLAALIGIYGLMNILAAVLPGYDALVGTRFLAGLPHGGYLGVAMLFAADALPKEQRAKGVTQVLLGLTVANIAGVPLAGWMGQELGWRWGFALPGAVALLAAVLILKLAPRVGADPNARPWSEMRALSNPGVILILLVGAIGNGGMFAIYSFLTKAMLELATPPGWAVPVTLALFGIGMTVASIAAARITIRVGAFRASLYIMCFMMMAQVFAALSVGSWRMMVLSSLVLGLGSGLFVPLQTRLMEVAGHAQSMAAAMNHASFNAANALGPWLAGMALYAGWGWRSPAYVALGLTVLGLLSLALAFWQARRSGTV